MNNKRWTEEQVKKYWDGFDKYCDGMPEPLNPEEKQGWWFALDCQAQAAIAHEEQQDEEHHRRGWW